MTWYAGVNDHERFHSLKQPCPAPDAAPRRRETPPAWASWAFDPGKDYIAGVIGAIASAS
jgi:hypothetical protein